jgi:ribosome-associated translation inhibitor RaiA
MKVSFSYKIQEAHASVEQEAERHLPKLSRLLKTYSPDLVQLHGVLAHNSHKGALSLSLNLSLPTGTLHVAGSGSDLRPLCKQVFSELESKVKKHQSRLRKQYEWRRKSPRAEALS